MLHLHRAAGTAPLADALAALLRGPLPDVLATEVVAVPAQGVERWLTQRLSGGLGAGPGGRDGICSGVRFPSTGRLLAEALAGVGAPAREDDPWAGATWPVLEVLDGCLGEPWARVLARHLGADADAPARVAASRRGRRWSTAAHLATLFASYSAHRPQMLRDWAEGRDTDGEGPLPGDLRWQAELWRRLRARLGPSPAELLGERCAAIVAAPQRLDLPERVSVFGPTRLTASELAVLGALGAGRDVHLWLPHPSPALWDAVAPLVAGPVRRRLDPTATVARHPLLRSLSRDVRELQQRLPAGAVHRYDADADSGADAGVASATGTLLARLQADLRGDLTPSPAAPDASLQVHACHGPARQVEVLRELLLGLFEDDPALEPRDVVVLCPDVETFAPLVSAAFGLGPGMPHPGHALRVRLADRSLRRTNPLLDTVARLLELAGSRVTASAVLDLAASGPVRSRFSLSDEDLERLHDWVARSGVRWGLDAAHRAPWGLSGVPQNTWRTGLDRVLLGVAVSEDEPVWLGLALPLDDVDSSDADLAGRFAELLDRLELVLDRLSGEHPVDHWVQALLDGLDLLTLTPDADAWQAAQARQELADAARGGTSSVGLSDVRAALAERLRGRPTRAGFRTGDLTVCTLVPMRSVPHRVVVLLGLDDGVFPRAAGTDGDDVLARDPFCGERDVRGEDRQLLLDAVLAAGERLVVLHTGADPVTGAARPPAVPVGELLDVVEAMAPGGREAVVVRHALQPHDQRSFTGEPPASFDRVSLAGARRALSPVPAPLRQPLPRRSAPVALDDLVGFLEHPVRGYLRQRLRLTLPGEDDEVDDALSLRLSGLQEWAVAERMLDAALHGRDRALAERAEWLRGTLPPGPLGVAVLARVHARVGPLVEAAAPHLAPPPASVDLLVPLLVAGEQRVLSGTVNDVRDGCAVAVTTSTLSARHRVRAWALALALAASGQGDRAVVVGRIGSRPVVSTLVAPPDPAGVLSQLVDLRDRGLCEPLPLAVKSSCAYATARGSGGIVEQAAEAAAREWDRDLGGERSDRYHVHVWGEGAPLDALLAAPSRGDEAWSGETSRFGALAGRLWAPLLAAESRS